MTFKQIKKKYKLTNQDISQIFGYKNSHSFSQATRKPKIEKGIEELYRIFKSQ